MSKALLDHLGHAPDCAAWKTSWTGGAEGTTVWSETGEACDCLASDVAEMLRDPEFLEMTASACAALPCSCPSVSVAFLHGQADCPQHGDWSARVAAVAAVLLGDQDSYGFPHEPEAPPVQEIFTTRIVE